MLLASIEAGSQWRPTASSPHRTATCSCRPTRSREYAAQRQLTRRSQRSGSYLQLPPAQRQLTCRRAPPHTSRPRPGSARSVSPRLGPLRCRRGSRAPSRGPPAAICPTGSSAAHLPRPLPPLPSPSGLGAERPRTNGILASQNRSEPVEMAAPPPNRGGHPCSTRASRSRSLSASGALWSAMTLSIPLARFCAESIEDREATDLSDG